MPLSTRAHKHTRNHQLAKTWYGSSIDRLDWAFLRHDARQNLRDLSTRAVDTTDFGPGVKEQSSPRLCEYEGGIPRRLIASSEDVKSWPDALVVGLTVLLLP